MKPADRRNNLVRNLVTRNSISNVSYKAGVRMLQLPRAGDGDPYTARHREPFGFSSHVPKGGDAVVVSLGGNKSQSFVICAYNEEYLVVLKEGESTQYNQWGDKVTLTESGDAHIVARARVLAECPLFECTGNAKIGGRLDVAGEIKGEEDVIAGTVSLQNHLTTNVTPGTGLGGKPQ